MPERYARTPAYFALRVAERYGAAGGGMDPVAWFDGLPAGTQELLLAQERVRISEHERDVDAAAR